MAAESEDQKNQESPGRLAMAGAFFFDLAKLVLQLTALIIIISSTGIIVYKTWEWIEDDLNGWSNTYLGWSGISTDSDAGTSAKDAGASAEDYLGILKAFMAIMPLSVLGFGIFIFLMRWLLIPIEKIGKKFRDRILKTRSNNGIKDNEWEISKYIMQFAGILAPLIAIGPTVYSTGVEYHNIIVKNPIRIENNLIKHGGSHYLLHMENANLDTGAGIWPDPKNLGWLDAYRKGIIQCAGDSSVEVVGYSSAAPATINGKTKWSNEANCVIANQRALSVAAILALGNDSHQIGLMKEHMANQRGRLLETIAEGADDKKMETVCKSMADESKEKLAKYSSDSSARNLKAEPHLWDSYIGMRHGKPCNDGSVCHESRRTDAEFLNRAVRITVDSEACQLEDPT